MILNFRHYLGFWSADVSEIAGYLQYELLETWH